VLNVNRLQNIRKRLTVRFADEIETPLVIVGFETSTTRAAMETGFITVRDDIRARGGCVRSIRYAFNVLLLRRPKVILMQVRGTPPSQTTVVVTLVRYAK